MARRLESGGENVQNLKSPIRKFVRFINNEEEQGGLWLPNIQRNFIWDEEQIEKLFDSIMREYPIGSLLIWKTKEPIKIRKFNDNYKEGLKVTDFYVPTSKKTKLIVLDGQQRLQSLFIGLKGSYNGKELYFNVFSGKEEIEDIKFEFKFLEPSKADISHGWVKVKDIVYDNRNYDEIAESIVEKIEKKGSSISLSKVRKNILTLLQQFIENENIITYIELDSVDNPEQYTLNDIVEIFIRANSGGTPLSKSDLMFSLLTTKWEGIEEDLTNFLEDLNGTAFNFSRDFVLKTSLILIDTGAKYDVMKFRNETNLQKLQSNWENIKNSIREIRDFIFNYTYIRDDKALPSYLALIPLIYFNYNLHNKWKDSNKKLLANWLTRVLLTGAFSGSSDTLLDAIIKKIKNDFNIEEINKEIRDRGRRTTISRDSLLNTYYGEKKLYLIFALWYQNINFNPVYYGNLPWVDHIFPQSKLKKINKKDRDQIANLMLLSAEENRDEKKDKLPEEWLKDKNDDYFDIHLIPRDKELWKLENFEKFVEKRKKLIEEKFKKMDLLEELHQQA